MTGIGGCLEYIAELEIKGMTHGMGHHLVYYN